MKLSIFAVLSLVAVALSAQAPQKNIIVSYDDNVPDSVINEAMDAIKAAGGFITHEYKLLKGFAAKAPAKVLETVQAWGSQYNAVIEEDQMVTIVGGGDF